MNVYLNIIKIELRWHVAYYLIKIRWILSKYFLEIMAKCYVQLFNYKNETIVSGKHITSVSTLIKRTQNDRASAWPRYTCSNKYKSYLSKMLST